MALGIGLIYWKVKKSKADEFPDFWEEYLRIKDKKSLIFEALSKVEPADHDKFTWDIYNEKGVNFINVGLWTSKEDFLKEMGKIPKEVIDKVQEFKYDETIRIWITPEKIRKGDREIKIDDVDFVE